MQSSVSKIDFSYVCARSKLSVSYIYRDASRLVSLFQCLITMLDQIGNVGHTKNVSMNMFALMHKPLPTIPDPADHWMRELNICTRVIKTMLLVSNADGYGMMSTLAYTDGYLPQMMDEMDYKLVGKGKMRCRPVRVMMLLDLNGINLPITTTYLDTQSGANSIAGVTLHSDTGTTMYRYGYREILITVRDTTFIIRMPYLSSPTMRRFKGNTPWFLTASMNENVSADELKLLYVYSSVRKKSHGSMRLDDIESIDESEDSLGDRLTTMGTMSMMLMDIMAMLDLSWV